MRETSLKPSAQTGGWPKRTATLLDFARTKTGRSTLNADRPVSIMIPNANCNWKILLLYYLPFLIAACAAAKRATGTRNGEQLT